MLQQVRGRDRGDLAAVREHLSVIAVKTPGPVRRRSDGNLLQAGVDPVSVIAVSEQWLDQLTLAAADVDNRPGGRRWQHRADIATVDQSTSLTAPATGMLGRIGLVQSISQCPAVCSSDHAEIILHHSRLLSDFRKYRLYVRPPVPPCGGTRPQPGMQQAKTLRRRACLMRRELMHGTGAKRCASYLALDRV